MMKPTTCCPDIMMKLTAGDVTHDDWVFRYHKSTPLVSTAHSRTSLNTITY